MRSIIVVTIERASIELAPGADHDEAYLAVLNSMLRDEGLLYADDKNVVQRGEIIDAFNRLKGKAKAGNNLPTEPDDRLIQVAAESALEGRAADDESGTLDRAKRVLCQSLSILAQIPNESRDGIATELRGVVGDRERDVYGLLFQRGCRFTIRLRFREPDTLKAATDRFVNSLASRPASEASDLIRDIPAVRRFNESLGVEFQMVEMKTPSNEVAQIGEVHQVRSQYGLLKSLAVQKPQSYLVLLTAALALSELMLQLFAPAWNVREVNMTEWTWQFCARLSSGAFGAYLVALFLRFADLRGHLRSTVRNRSFTIARPAFGAFVEWSVSSSPRH